MLSFVRSELSHMAVPPSRYKSLDPVEGFKAKVGVRHVLLMVTWSHACRGVPWLSWLSFGSLSWLLLLSTLKLQ